MTLTQLLPTIRRLLAGSTATTLLPLALNLLPQPTFAINYPRGCEVTGFAYQNEQLVLNETGEQTFYLIQNRREIPIELERYQDKEVFMSPKLTTRFSPNRYAAFASDMAQMHFQCFEQQLGERVAINCADALEVCQYPRAKFPLSNMGSYWISTNKTREQVIKDASEKGIYLRW